MIDMHIHTKYSDGKPTVSEYVETAYERGFKRICFTDHVDFSTTWFGKYTGEIASKRRIYKNIDIIHGIEVRAKDLEGGLNAPTSIVDGADIVIGVVHSIPAEDGMGKLDPRQFSPDKLLEIEYSLSLNLVKNDNISVLGHPMSNYEKLYGPVPLEYYREIISKAIENGKAIEISAKYKNDFKGFLDLCLELNPIVSLGSDAHSIDELGMIGARLSEALQ